MRIVLFLYILLSSEIVIAELLKPTPNLQPQEVISIQLNALKDNNNPYEDAGIEQTWLFAQATLNHRETEKCRVYIQIYCYLK